MNVMVSRGKVKRFAGSRDLKESFPLEFTSGAVYGIPRVNNDRYLLLFNCLNEGRIG
jgi:hypothetical protein